MQCCACHPRQRNHLRCRISQSSSCPSSLPLASCRGTNDLHLKAATLLQERYKLNVPNFPGTAQCVRIKPPAAGNGSAQRQAGSQTALSDMRENYSQGGLLEKDADLDPMKQFDKW